MRLFFWMLTTAFLAGLFFADNTAKAVETALTADEAASHQASAAARDVLLAQRGKKKKRGRGHGKRSSGGKRFPPYKPSPAPERVTSGLYFIDAHSQMDENVNEERVISLMDHGGVRRTILSTHMQRDWSDIPDFAEAYPGRIIPSVRIKGRGYHRGSADAFYDRVGGQVTDGRFGSMSEVHFWHDSDGGKYQEIIIGFKDTLAMYAFAKAKKRGWPFIIHVEANAIPDERREPFLAEMNAFLARNPGTDGNDFAPHLPPHEFLDCLIHFFPGERTGNGFIDLHLSYFHSHPDLELPSILDSKLSDSRLPKESP